MRIRLLACLVVSTVFVAACASTREQPAPKSSEAASASSSNAGYKKLELSLDKPVVGADVRVAVNGLASNANVELQWGTVTGGWVIEDYYHFRGKKYEDSTTSLGQFKTDANGRFEARFKIPEDYGGV